MSANILEKPASLSTYASFLKMEAAGLSKIILVDQTVTLHPGRPDADHFMM